MASMIEECLLLPPTTLHLLPRTSSFLLPFPTLPSILLPTSPSLKDLDRFERSLALLAFRIKRTPPPTQPCAALVSRSRNLVLSQPHPSSPSPLRPRSPLPRPSPSILDPLIWTSTPSTASVTQLPSIPRPSNPRSSLNLPRPSPC